MGRNAKRRQDARQTVTIERFLAGAGAPFEGPDDDDLLASDLAGRGVSLPAYELQQAYLAWTSGHYLTALGRAGEVRRALEDFVDQVVDDARAQGHSWGDIGSALGMTRQAVQQRVARRAGS